MEIFQQIPFGNHQPRNRSQKFTGNELPNYRPQKYTT